MSSFAEVPAVVLTGVGLAPFMSSRLGRRLYGCGSRVVRASRLAAVLFAGGNTAAVTGAAADVVQVVVTGRDGQDSARGLVAPTWTTLQAYVFRHGWPCGCAYLLAAVLLHHVRRTLWPGLGGYVLADAGEDWRLVLARPDVFLEQVLATASWPRLLQSSAQKRAVDVIAGGGCALFLAADDDGLAVAVQQAVASHGHGHGHGAAARTVMRRAKDAAAVILLLWLFSCVEYAVVRIFDVGALFFAVGSLLRSGAKAKAEAQAEAEAEAETDVLTEALRRALARDTVSAALLFWSQLVAYPAWGVCPLLWTAVHAAVGGRRRRRQPGLLVAVLAAIAAMYALLRYRSRLYIAIETSGLFVVLAFAALSGLLVLADVRDRRARREAADGKKKRR